LLAADDDHGRIVRLLILTGQRRGEIGLRNASSCCAFTSAAWANSCEFWASSITGHTPLRHNATAMNSI
jgi:hypothetical protein